MTNDAYVILLNLELHPDSAALKNQETKQSQTVPKNFGICFCAFLSASTKYLFLQGRLTIRPCLHAVLRFC